MKIKLLILAPLLLCINMCFSQSKDELEIRSVLAQQTLACNNGNLDNFMKGYWQNDSLMFVGKSEITYGYENTLENYKKRYSDTIAMGKLDFDLIKVKRLSVLYYFVIGKWHLARSIGDLSGHFTLLFEKIKNKWVIITDHSS